MPPHYGHDPRVNNSVLSIPELAFVVISCTCLCYYRQYHHHNVIRDGFQARHGPTETKRSGAPFLPYCIRCMIKKLPGICETEGAARALGLHSRLLVHYGYENYVFHSQVSCHVFIELLALYKYRVFCLCN